MKGSLKKKNNKQTKRRGKPYIEQRPQVALQTRVLGTGFPDTTRTTLQYTDTITISGASFQTVYTFRGNSCYDPDYTSSGHQPAYFDTFSEVYGKYKVYGARIRLTIANNTNDATCLAIIPHSDPLGVGSSVSALLDLPRSRWVPIGAANIMPAKITHSASTSEILGLTSRQIEDDDYSATTTANPNQLWYFNLFLFNIDSAVLAPKVSVVLQIFYDVKFYDKVFVSPSFQSKPTHLISTIVPQSKKSGAGVVSPGTMGNALH